MRFSMLLTFIMIWLYVQPAYVWRGSIYSPESKDTVVFHPWEANQQYYPLAKCMAELPWKIGDEFWEERQFTPNCWTEKPLFRCGLVEVRRGNPISQRSMVKSLAKHLFRWRLGAGFGGVLVDLLLGLKKGCEQKSVPMSLLPSRRRGMKLMWGQWLKKHDNMSSKTQIGLLVHFTMLMDLSPRHSMFAVVIPVSRISGGTRMSSTKDELIAALLNRDDWLDILVQKINPVTGPLRLKLEVVLLRRVSEPNLFLTVLQSSKSALSNSLVTHIACQGLRGYKRSEA